MGHSSKPGPHIKSASKPNFANCRGQLTMKTKYPFSKRVGMPSLQSGTPRLHSDHRLLDTLQERFSGRN
jgi:hypothetical protein